MIWTRRAVLLAAAFVPLPCASAAAAAPPRVSIAAPAAGAQLSGTVVIAAHASSPAGIAAVQFLLDGAELGARVNSPPYVLSWNTNQAAGDTHLLSAVAWDNAGSSATAAAVSVIVDNTPLLASDVAALDVARNEASIVWTTNQPASGQVEYGPTAAYGSSTALDAAPAVGHKALLSGLSPGTTYHYRVKSENASGLLSVSGDFAFVTLAPFVDVVPPSVAILNPASGSFVSGSVTVSANASDNVGVASVQFLLDGGELGAPMTAAPYVRTWDTTLVADGAHTLGATARDEAGNSQNSAVVSVTVSNTPPVIGTPSVAGAAPDHADVLWTTDQRSDSAADYGPTPGYGNSTPVTSAQSTGHAVSLTGLAPGTLYHYRVKSRNAAGVLSVSGDFTFSTPGAGAAAALGPAATGDASAKAPQKFLTPASADGVNDKAVFGPEAREVSIFDLHGRQVFHGSSPGPGSPIVWNCRDSAGNVVPSGVYIAKILTRDSGQIYQSFAVAK